MNNVNMQDVLNVIEKANLVKDVNSLDVEKPLSKQGIDSLDFSGVLFNMEEAFDVEIPDEDIDKLQTLSAILDYLNK